MRVIRSSQLQFVAASHEDPKNPGVLKKVLFKRDDLMPGRIQMLNWAHLPVGSAFRPHFHEDMQEIFLIVTGQAEISVGDLKANLTVGDAVLIDPQARHEMRNIGKVAVEYVVIGIAKEQGGKTVTVS